MKNIFIGLILFFYSFNSFSQESPYYQLYDYSSWEFGLVWDDNLQDWSTVSLSDIAFYYYPKKSNCTDKVFYKLTKTSDYNIDGETIMEDPGMVWQYKDNEITIRVRMIQVETFFGYQIYDVNIINKTDTICGPQTIYLK